MAVYMCPQIPFLRHWRQTTILNLGLKSIGCSSLGRTWWPLKDVTKELDSDRTENISTEFNFMPRSRENREEYSVKEAKSEAGITR